MGEPTGGMQHNQGHRQRFQQPAMVYALRITSAALSRRYRNCRASPICMRCGHPANHTQRLLESSDLIVVGATGMYEAHCRRCFEPGVCKQKVLEFAKPRAATQGQ